MPMFQELLKVVKNHEVSPGCYLMELACGTNWDKAKAGQFVSISIPHVTDPLLRRPFSIHRIKPAVSGNRLLAILYKVVGRFTRELTRIPPDGEIDILGPLGNGFFIPEALDSAVLVAGGIGIAPMPILIENLMGTGLEPGNIYLVIGARNKDELPACGNIKLPEKNIIKVTQDGSMGKKGLATDALNEILTSSGAGMVYACGPVAMLEVVASVCHKNTVPCQVSMETIMACGVGICLGCAIPHKKNGSGFLHVCKDGPVFDGDLLVNIHGNP